MYYLTAIAALTLLTSLSCQATLAPGICYLFDGTCDPDADSRKQDCPDGWPSIVEGKSGSTPMRMKPLTTEPVYRRCDTWYIKTGLNYVWLLYKQTVDTRFGVVPTVKNIFDFNTEWSRLAGSHSRATVHSIAMARTYKARRILVLAFHTNVVRCGTDSYAPPPFVDETCGTFRVYTCPDTLTLYPSDNSLSGIQTIPNQRGMAFASSVWLFDEPSDVTIVSISSCGKEFTIYGKNGTSCTPRADGSYADPDGRITTYTPTKLVKYTPEDVIKFNVIGDIHHVVCTVYPNDGLHGVRAVSGSPTIKKAITDLGIDIRTNLHSRNYSWQPPDLRDKRTCLVGETGPSVPDRLRSHGHVNSSLLSASGELVECEQYVVISSRTTELRARAGSGIAPSDEYAASYVRKVTLALAQFDAIRFVGEGEGTVVDDYEILTADREALTLYYGDPRFLKTCGFNERSKPATAPGDCASTTIVECHGPCEVWVGGSRFSSAVFTFPVYAHKLVLPIYASRGTSTLSGYRTRSCDTPGDVTFTDRNPFLPFVSFESTHHSLSSNLLSFSVPPVGSRTPCQWSGYGCATVANDSITPVGSRRLTLVDHQYRVSRSGECYNFTDGYLCRGCREFAGNRYCIHENFADVIPDKTYHVMIPLTAVSLAVTLIATAYLFWRQRRLSAAVLLFMQRVNPSASVYLEAGEKFSFTQPFELTSAFQTYDLSLHEILYQSRDTDVTVMWQVAYFGLAYYDAMDRCPTWFMFAESPPDAHLNVGVKVVNGKADIMGTKFIDDWSCLDNTFDIWGKCRSCDGPKRFSDEKHLYPLHADADSETHIGENHIHKLIYRRVGCAGIQCPVPKTKPRMSGCGNAKELVGTCANRWEDGDEDRTITVAYNLIIHIKYAYQRLFLYTVTDSTLSTTFKYDGISTTFTDNVYYNATNKLRVRALTKVARLFVRHDDILYRTEVAPAACEDYFLRFECVEDCKWVESYCYNLDIASGIGVTPWTGTLTIPVQGNRLYYLADAFKRQHTISNSGPCAIGIPSTCFSAGFSGSAFHVKSELAVDASMGVTASAPEAFSNCTNITATADCGSTCYYTIRSTSPGFVRVQGRLKRFACHGGSCETHFSSQHHYFILSVQCTDSHSIRVTFSITNFTLSSTTKYSQSGVKAEMPKPVGKSTHADLWGVVSKAFSSLGNFFKSLTQPFFFVPLIMAAIGIGLFIFLLSSRKSSTSVVKPMSDIVSVADYNWICIRFKDRDLCVGILHDSERVHESVCVLMPEGKNFNDLKTDGTDHLLPGNAQLTATYAVDCSSAYRGLVSFDNGFTVTSSNTLNCETVSERLMSAYALEKKMSFPLANIRI